MSGKTKQQHQEREVSKLLEIEGHIQKGADAEAETQEVSFQCVLLGFTEPATQEEEYSLNLVLESSTEDAGLEEGKTGVESPEVETSEADVGNDEDMDTLVESGTREEGEPGAEIPDMVVTEAEPGQEVGK